MELNIKKTKPFHLPYPEFSLSVMMDRSEWIKNLMNSFTEIERNRYNKEFIIVDPRLSEFLKNI